VTSGCAYPLIKPESSRLSTGPLLVLLVAVLPVLWGCQTAPEGLDPLPGGASGLHHLDREDAAFLTVANVLGRPGDGEFFFSFETWPAGRDIAGEYLPDAVRGIQRIRRIWGGASSLHPSASYTLVMEMTISRFLSSIALNAEGWTRTDWGEWHHPEEAVTVSFRPGRIWVVTAAAEGDDTPGGAVIPSLAAEGPQVRDPAGGDGPGRAVLAGLLVVRDPELEGVPGEFAPREMRAFLYADAGSSAGSTDGTFVVELLFPDERRARIALVPIRLRASRFLNSYGFMPRDDFDILRSGDTIHIHGLSLSDPKGAASADSH
jgi:hypothetical protein